MPDAFKDAFSGSSSTAFPWHKAPKSSKPAHHSLAGNIIRGPGHFVEHLAKDVRDAAVGLPFGLIRTVEHPIGSAKMIGETTWKDWSPLFRGHPAEFAKQFYAHPLAPLLDIATVATLGGAGAAQAGKVAAKIGAVSEESTFAKLGEASHKTLGALGEGKPQGLRQYSSNPVLRARERGLDKLRAESSAHLPKWFGEGGVRDYSEAGQQNRWIAKNVAHRSSAKTYAAAVDQLVQFVKAGKKLTEEPHAAAMEIERGAYAGMIDHAYRMKPEELTGKRGTYRQLTQDFKFVARKPRGIAKSGFDFKQPDVFRDYMHGFARRHTTRDVRKALRDEQGNYLVVPQHAGFDAKEAIHSERALKLLYNNPTKVWKWAVLATAPRYFVNNAVGNMAMYMLDFGGHGATQGFVRAVNQTRKGGRDWQHRWFLQAHQGFTQDVLGELNTGNKVTRTIKSGLYPVTHKLTDVLPRRAAINTLIRKEPEFQRLTKEGYSFDKAADIVSADPVVRDRITNQVENALGDYLHLNKTEKAIRQLIPFYTWDRAIARHSLHLALDHPARAAAVANIGTQGSQATMQALGNVPSFMEGYIPLGKGHGKNLKALATQGINPYASTADVVDSLVNLVAGNPRQAAQSIGSQVGPIPAGAIEYLTGQRLLSGAKIPSTGGGLVGNIAGNQATSTPLGQLLKTAIQGAPKPSNPKKPFLFEKGMRPLIEAWLGAPIKQINPTAAESGYRKEHGIKKGRSHRKAWPPKGYGF